MSAVLLTPPPYRSAEWHDWRTHGLGASDIPDLLGCGYHTEYELWTEKVRGGQRESSDVMRFGAFVEAYALDRYEEDKGVRLVRGETFSNPRWPHLWATLDGRDGRIGVEVKYDTKGWDALPRKHEVQALGQIGLGDLDAVDVLRVSTRGQVTPFRVERDDETIVDLLDFSEEWWARYVIGGEEPPLDDSPASRKALDRLRGDGEREADERQRELLAALRFHRGARESAERAEEQCIRDLKASMAGMGVLTAPDARVTWAAVKGSTKVGWQQVAQGLRTRVTPEEWEAVVSLATTVGEPGTRFAVKFEEGNE